MKEEDKNKEFEEVDRCCEKCFYKNNENLVGFCVFFCWHWPILDLYCPFYKEPEEL